MVDQKTIAEKAGVSRATVSRAFTQNANVSPRSLAKIQAAMESLGLQPLAWFPSGIRKKSKYVLILCGDISNAFFSQVIKGISDRLLALGLLPVVCNSNYNADLEESQIEMADTNNYLGIIFVTATERPTLAATLYRTNTPVILVNRYIHSFETHTVCIDNYEGGYIAAMHLIEKGHRRIAHIASYKGTTPQMDRIQGFQEAMQCLPRGEYRYQVYFGDGTLERGNQVARELIKNGMPYTALFVADCQIAIGIVNTLREQGFRVPTDVSILCFDDSPYINQYGLRLSTVTYNPLSMGSTAVDLLAQLMSDRLSSISHVNLTPQLIQRDSVMDINKR